jgi:hypothetical protein
VCECGLATAVPCNVDCMSIWLSAAWSSCDSSSNWRTRNESSSSLASCNARAHTHTHTHTHTHRTAPFVSVLKTNLDDTHIVTYITAKRLELWQSRRIEHGFSIGASRDCSGFLIGRLLGRCSRALQVVHDKRANVILAIDGLRKRYEIQATLTSRGNRCVLDGRILH